MLTHVLWSGQWFEIRLRSRVADGSPLSVVVLGGSGTCGAYVVADAWSRVRHGYEKPRDATINGTTRQEQEEADGRPNAWPAWLAKILRDAWGERVTVTNLCERAVATEYWVAEVRRGGSRAKLDRADIVLVETASNDGFEHGAEAYTRPVENTQLLLQSLLALPRRPFIMWVTALWREFAHQRHSSAEAAHLSVLGPADIPHTSLARLFGPTKNNPELALWLTKIYYQDCCHPSTYGQKLISAVVGRRLIKQLGTWPRAPATSGATSAFPNPMAPSILDDHAPQPSPRIGPHREHDTSASSPDQHAARWNQSGFTAADCVCCGCSRGGNSFVGCNSRSLVCACCGNGHCSTYCAWRAAERRRAVRVSPSPVAAPPRGKASGAAVESFYDWTSRYIRDDEHAEATSPVVHSKGFEHTADHAAKLGLVSTQLGALVLLRLPPHTHRVLLGMLHSYEGVGAIALELLHAEAAGEEGACDHWSKATASPLPAVNGPNPPSHVLDTLWPLRASVHHFVDASVTDEMDAACMWLRGTAVEAQPPRRSHKLKLLNMIAFAR